jgi:hypothetical protein
MHWFHIPRVIHNEDAIREYERAESRRIGRLLRWLLLGLPLIVLGAWLLLR